MSTLILGALEEELSEFRTDHDRTRAERWNGAPISHGEVVGSRVVVASCGVGKTMSALTAQHLIDRYAPERVLLVGIAGSLDETLDIGDVVVARDTVQYDLDARAAGFEIGHIPFTSYREIPCDTRLVAAALSCPAEGYRLVAGRILTGDRVLSRLSPSSLGSLRELGGDAVEMEGASVGLVALVNRVPFLLLRVISDKADGSAKADFRKFLPIASKRTFQIVAHVLSVLHSSRS